MEYSKGKILEGKIIHVEEEYMLIKFPNKETGILHKSKMSPQPEGDLTNFYHRNQSILVSIDGITAKGYTLGRKDIENRFENQQRHEAKELEKQKRAAQKERMQKEVERSASLFERGVVYEAEVIKLSNHGAKINIAGINIDGYIEKEELNWNENESVKESLFEGEIIHAVFLEYTDGKLLFGLKYLEGKPYDEKLYDLPLIDLLKYAGHKSNVFIGQAKQLGEFTFIDNLYSCDEDQNGKLLIDPIYGYNLKAVAINQFKNQLIDGEYYKVELARLVDKGKRQERNQLFQFTAEIIDKVDNPYKKDVDRAFKKLTSPAGNVAIAHLLKEVVGNMLAAKDRMFFELVQNADDAASSKGVHIKVKTVDDFLIVSHNGLSFDKDDFDAIVSAANGTKKTDENKTGYKGIGFKTVFKEANRVYIKTGGYQFKFDKSDARFTDFDSFYFSVNDLKTKEQQQTFIADRMDERNKFKGVDDIPWQLEPIWVDVFPESLGQNFTKSNVSIALEIGKHKMEGEEGYCQAIESIINNPKFMLFLRNTNRIDFNDKSVSKIVNDGEVVLKNSFNESRLQHYKILDYNVRINAIEERNLGFYQNIIEQNNEGKIIDANFVDSANQIIDNIPSKIALNEFTTISFAIPIDENGAFINTTIPKEKDISIFAFLPTLVKEFDFTVFVNANFLLTPDRQHILGDNPWNYFLMEELADKLVELAANLCLKKDYNALYVLKPKCFEYQTPDVKHLAEHFDTAYKSALESEAFILNHKGELAKQEDIIIDGTGLSEIVGADLFCQLLKTEKCLPSEKIDSKILGEDIFKLIKTMKFDDVISTITNNSEFNDWFTSASDEKKKALYKWINDKDIQSRKDDLRLFVSKLPLFNFGESFKSCKEINSSNYIITTEHIKPIKEILSKLSFICSENLFDENHPLYAFVNLQDEVDLFNSIKDCDFAELTANERRKLFFSLSDFKGVRDEKLKKEIALFKNLKGGFKPLGEMVAYRENVPLWFKDYVLCKEDYSTELSDYLIAQNYEFESIIQKTIEDIKPKTTWAELYDIYKNEWTGQFTCNIIDNNDIDTDILTIIEESDTKTKEYFLNSIKKLELHSTSTYKKDSYEYRVLQLALSVYDEPSDFSSKIYFDGQCIKDFSVSDDVVCEYTQSGKTKKVKMSLAKLLPQYQNQSDSIDKIKALFESTKDLDKFFVAKPKSIYDVHKELDQHLAIPEYYFSEWHVDGNAQQFLFATYYRRQKKGWNNLYVPKIDLNNETDEFVYELLEFLFDNSVSIEESPFTYHLKKYFVDKYFDSDFIFENEQILPIIEQWANDDKKKKCLIDNGVRTEGCYAIQFRKLFLENKPIDFIDKLEDEEINSGIEFVTTANGFDRPFVGENQKHVLLTLKDKCKDLSDNWDEEKMEEKSEEWDAKEYNEWIEDHNPQIFIYHGILPSKLSYKDELLLNYENSDYNYYYNKDKRQLFVTSTKKIEDILFEVAKEDKSNLDIDDYKFLCWDGKESLTKEEKDDYDNLKEEKDKIKLALQKRGLNYDDLLKGDGSNEGITIQEPIEGANAIFKEKSGQHTSEIINAESAINDGFEVYKPSHNLTRAQENYNDTYLGDIYSRDGVSIDEQIKIHKEAMSAAKEYLESKNFDFSKSDYVQSSEEFEKFPKWRSACQIHNVVKKSNEKSVTVVVKSSKGGYVYLSATDFQTLTECKDNILILYDNKGCHSVSYDELFKGSDVNLIFDPEYTPEHYYVALGKIFTYIKRSTFVIKNPNYNIHDAIKSFGMDSKTEDIQDLFDDNNDL
jgi:predicted RNA-binding protein with RPS1 domain